MKSKIFPILFLFLFITGCRQQAKPPELSASSIEVTDFRNKEIRLQKPATRIVCLIESALSGIYMLHAENQVIGVSTAIYNESVSAQYAILDERIKRKQLPAPGNWDFVSIENIVALQPDLVIIWASQTESIQSIEEHGIPVYAIFLKSLDDVYKEITDLGALTGKTQRADSLISYTKNEISNLNNKIKPSVEAQKTVYFMWSQGLLETAGTTSTVNELIELAGAKNSCNINHEHVVISKEKLLDWNPDVWIMWCNTTMNPDNILNLTEFKNINAIKNEQVFELPSVFMCDLWTLK
ncbi:MAG: ABC transporter substrate-binding protein, partial [Chloroflexia bacterium]|nr:ABC transporter substrate-binding protein [Chloroflexia bacterium]